jgi:hypothetical protein
MLALNIILKHLKMTITLKIYLKLLKLARKEAFGNWNKKEDFNPPKYDKTV